jgi:hypothetical protein
MQKIIGRFLLMFLCLYLSKINGLEAKKESPELTTVVLIIKKQKTTFICSAFSRDDEFFFTNASNLFNPKTKKIHEEIHCFGYLNDKNQPDGQKRDINLISIYPAFTQTDTPHVADDIAIFTIYQGDTETDKALIKFYTGDLERLKSKTSIQAICNHQNMTKMTILEWTLSSKNSLIKYSFNRKNDDRASSKLIYNRGNPILICNSKTTEYEVLGMTLGSLKDVDMQDTLEYGLVFNKRILAWARDVQEDNLSLTLDKIKLYSTPYQDIDEYTSQFHDLSLNIPSDKKNKDEIKKLQNISKICNIDYTK